MEWQVGLASIAAAVQRAGGTAQHPGEALDEDLEVIAASIETAALPEVYVLGHANPALFGSYTQRPRST